MATDVVSCADGMLSAAVSHLYQDLHTTTTSTKLVKTGPPCRSVVLTALRSLDVLCHTSARLSGADNIPASSRTTAAAAAAYLYFRRLEGILEGVRGVCPQLAAFITRLSRHVSGVLPGDLGPDLTLESPGSCKIHDSDTTWEFPIYLRQGLKDLAQHRDGLGTATEGNGYSLASLILSLQPPKDLLGDDYTVPVNSNRPSRHLASPELHVMRTPGCPPTGPGRALISVMIETCWKGGTSTVSPDTRLTVGTAGGGVRQVTKPILLPRGCFHERDNRDSATEICQHPVTHRNLEGTRIDSVNNAESTCRRVYYMVLRDRTLVLVVVISVNNTAIRAISWPYRNTSHPSPIKTADYALRKRACGPFPVSAAMRRWADKRARSSRYAELIERNQEVRYITDTTPIWGTFSGARNLGRDSSQPLRGGG
ncbi:hypothetical protein Bbelb_244070 [Branchiostoma belcheri]|nr:hypothetical protein Bbelb_244070 [Branchiostoma belcheri]